MKIAMMVRAYLPVPRPSDIVYANIDLAVDVAEGLARRGHQVDFYAPIGSSLRHVRVQDCRLPPLARNLEEFRDLLFDTDRLIHGLPQLWDEYMASIMFEKAARGGYDLLHFDHPESALALSRLYAGVPTVFTLHDPTADYHKEAYGLFQSPNQHYVSISQNQRRDAPDLPYLKTIHHGVDTRLFNFSPQTDGYLLFIGRIVPDKGVREAIQVAKRTNRRLLIIGPTYPDSLDYFERYVKPELNDRILYLGFVERDRLIPYYQKAEALLTPVQWEEPFGLTTIEAMACGTPVISFNRGAAPEIIKDGKTGFVVDTTEEMILSVAKIGTISREDCAQYVRNRFSLSKMTREYEEAFRQVIRVHRPKRTMLRRRLRRPPKNLRRAPRLTRIKLLGGQPRSPRIKR